MLGRTQRLDRAEDGDQRRVLLQGDEVVEQRRHDPAHGLRQDDEAHGLDTRESRGIGQQRAGSGAPSRCRRGRPPRRRRCRSRPGRPCPRTGTSSAGPTMPRAGMPKPNRKHQQDGRDPAEHVGPDRSHACGTGRNTGPRRPRMRAMTSGEHQDQRLGDQEDLDVQHEGAKDLGRRLGERLGAVEERLLDGWPARCGRHDDQDQDGEDDERADRGRSGCCAGRAAAERRADRVDVGRDRNAATVARRGGGGTGGSLERRDARFAPEPLFGDRLQGALRAQQRERCC